MQAINNNAAVYVRFIKNCPGQAWFSPGNVRHGVVQMGGEGNTGAEADFSLFQRGIGVPGRDHNPGTCQFTDNFRVDHFGRQGHFGDHICVGTQAINQLSVRLA
ncbi:hypothetical protein D3C79_989400 [compost metagenome]